MGKALLKNFKESILSILPLTLAVSILALFSIIQLNSEDYWRLIMAFIFLVIGMMLFNIGTNGAMLPMGEYIGATVIKKGRLGLLIIIIFVIGLLVTLVEPGVTILGGQVPIKTWTFVIFVSIGIGIFLVISLLRILFQWSQSTMFILGYGLIFMLIYFVDEGYIPMAFDASGATTGLLTVPLFMAIGQGAAKNAGGQKTHEDSFGLLGGASMGPILAVVAMGIFMVHRPIYQVEVLPDTSIWTDIWRNASENATNSLVVLGPLVIFFLVFQYFNVQLPKRQVSRIVIGIAFTFVGLIFFLTGASIGYVPIGLKIGDQLGQGDFSMVLLIGFIFGIVSAVAEPAVHVLSRQVEEVSDGAISFRLMLLTLSIGLGISIVLSLIRIKYQFSIMYYLVPGYAIALIFTQLVPNIYTGVAFDSGGAISGPMTASFVTPFVSGIALGMPGIASADLVMYALGTVAMVAMLPLLSIQALGFSTTIREKMQMRLAFRRVFEADDELIIYFPTEETHA